MDSKPSILNVNPDIIAIGDDWATKLLFSDGFYARMARLQQNCFKNIPYTKDISSSDIKNRIIKKVLK